MSSDEDIFGIILKEYDANPESEVIYVVERDDNYLDLDAANSYFASYNTWMEEERELVDRAQGKVLDLGCGAGRHSLYLESKGHEVLSLDISPGAVDICQKRGLKRVVQGSIFDLPKLFSEEKFDTLLVMGNNLPLSGSPESMVQLLRDMESITNTNSKILLFYVSPLPTTNPYHQTYHQKNKAQGRPIGTLRFRLRYKTHIGAWIDFYLPTWEEFEDIVGQTDWHISHHIAVRNFHFVELSRS